MNRHIFKTTGAILNELGDRVMHHFANGRLETLFPPPLERSGTPLPLETIISGGQTGVDRGALDAALALDFPASGWCPQDRRAEDGIIPPRYPVIPLAGAGYPQRTRRNVENSDGTLILFWGEFTRGQLTGGSGMTRACCLNSRHPRPDLEIDLHLTSEDNATEQILTFLNDHHIRRLNVAGPRASKWSQGQMLTARLLIKVLKICIDSSTTAA